MQAAPRPGLSRFLGAFLIVGAGAFLFLSWVITGVQIARDRAAQIAEGQRTIGNLTDVLREHVGSSLRAVEQALFGISTTIEVERLHAPDAAAGIHTVLARRQIATPGVLQFNISDEKGVIRHTSESPSAAPIDLSDRPNVRVIREGPRDGIFVTSMVRGQIGSTAGKWFFVVSRPLLRSDGSFAGHVSAVIEVHEFFRAFTALRLQGDSAAGVFHRDGTLMMRAPDPQQALGNKFPDVPLMQAIDRNPVEGYVAAPLSSGLRYQSYRQVPDGRPFIVFVSASARDVLEPWRNNVITAVIGQGALTFLVIFLALAMRGVIKRRAEADAAYLVRLERLGTVSGELTAHRDTSALLARLADIARTTVPSARAVVRLQEPGDPQSHVATAGQDAGAARATTASAITDPTGRAIGTIELTAYDDTPLSPGDVGLLGQLARIASVALENVRLLRDAEAATARARAARDEIAKIFETTSDGICIFDHDFRYTYVNDVYCRIAGAKREEMLGVKFVDRPTYHKGVHDKLVECAQSGKGVSLSNQFMAGDGVTRWIELQAFPAPPNVIVFVRDVTERQKAEQKLMESQRMDAVGRLTGGLAHDFNNLLAVVLGNAELLLSRLVSGPDIRLVELIQAAASRGADLVSRLLSFARRQPLDPKPVDIAAVISDVQNLLRRTLPENISLKTAHAPDLWPAAADVGQLENVLVNLVINARDAMPDGGAVTIEAANIELDQSYAASADIKPGPYVMLAVSDTGTGMSAEIVAKAFEPFFTTKDVGKGTGLGLSMVYGFARQSDGHVRLYSELGHGTTVKLYLPRAQPVAPAIPASPATTPAQPIPHGTETIMVVEDEDMVRDLVNAQLSQLGYNVVAYADADGALAALKAGMKPDLLLSDLVLTGSMNGRQMAEEMLRLQPGLRVLYMSGYTENAVVHQGRLDSGVQLITKPFRRADLAVRLRALLDAP